MTTAHRPTWAPAKGHEEQGGARRFGGSKQYSARDMASHTILKERKDGQDSIRDLEERDLKGELEAKERKHYLKKRGRVEGDEDLRLEGASRRELAPEQRLQPKAQDADDSADDNDDDDDDDDSDDDEDDTEELMKELERIKKERAEEANRKAAEDAKLEDAAKSAQLAKGNPLMLGQTSTFTQKRRWDDDVVFKNQARSEPKAVQRFINDTIRNDFHRRFLSKYMK